MARVSEGDPVADHRGAAEEPGPLDCIFSKAVADRVHCTLQARIARWGGSCEQVHLSRAGVAEPGESNAQSPYGAAWFAGREQLQCGLVDQVSCSDWHGQLRLFREAVHVRPVDDADGDAAAAPACCAQPPPTMSDRRIRSSSSSA